MNTGYFCTVLSRLAETHDSIGESLDIPQLRAQGICSLKAVFKNHVVDPNIVLVGCGLDSPAILIRGDTER